MIKLLITSGLHPEAPTRFSERSPRFCFWSASCSVTGGENTDVLRVKLDGDCWRGDIVLLGCVPLFLAISG